jgi:hypothetical protein
MVLACIIHERARMIAEDFAPSARRAEPQWWFHWDDKQRSDWGKRPANAGRKLLLAFPALPPSVVIAQTGKRGRTLC